MPTSHNPSPSHKCRASGDAGEHDPKRSRTASEASDDEEEENQPKKPLPKLNKSRSVDDDDEFGGYSEGISNLIFSIIY